MEQRTDILLLATGCYSDYSNAAFKVLKPFTMRQAYDEFRAQWTPTERYGCLQEKPNNDDFSAWLNKAGYIEDLPVYEVHIGDYGGIDISKDMLDVQFSPSIEAPDNLTADLFAGQGDAA